MDISTYKTTTIEETELIYTILREKYPTKQIEIEFNDNTKYYSIKVSDNDYINDPTVPLDITIKVCYGDSCTGNTPLLLMKDGHVYIETIEMIFDHTKKVEYPGFKIFDQSVRLEKEYSLTDFQVWTDQGWVNIKKVIRHKCDKKIYRVLTHTGCVDVSEDHSLLTPNLEKIKPNELNVGDALSHSFPTEFNEDLCIVKMNKSLTETFKCNTCNIMKKFTFEDYPLTEKEAEVWGMFQADGSTGSYNCKSGVKSSWSINNQDLDRLHYFKDILESIEPIKFEILDTLESSGVYKLVPKGNIKYMVEKYRPLFYYHTDCNAEGDKYKIVPNCILNASKEIKKSYWIGYWHGDSGKTKGFSIDNPSFAVKGKIGTQCMYYLMRSIGFDMYIQTNVNKDKENYYWLNQILNKSRDDTIIKKLYQIDTNSIDNYIYDLETDIGRFNCGVGQLQGSNTDSIFVSVKFNRENYELNRKDSFKLGLACGDNITNDLFNRPPIVLEFEKVYQPFILLTKKRYIGRKYEDISDPMKLKTLTTSGIAITRRDYCIMVKNCYREVINGIMDNSIEFVSDILKKYITRIHNFDIEFEDLVLSATLARSYQCSLCKEKSEWSNLTCETKRCNYNNTSTQLKTCPTCKKDFKCLHQFSYPHVNLAKKLLMRNEEISVNERIQYIYVDKNVTDNHKKTHLAETLEFAQSNNMRFNRYCYLQQLAKPLLGFLKVVLVNHQLLLDYLINIVNTNLELYGGDKLKTSDYKLLMD